MKKLIFVLMVLSITSAAIAQEKRITVPLNDSPSTGPADAAVTIIEFIDFQ